MKEAVGLTGKKADRKLLLAAFAYLLFCFWLTYQIPYTHDDWDWGLPIGIQQWLNASINSRYTGNFVVVLLTRSEALKTAVMGATLFILPALMTRIAAGPRSNDEPAMLRPVLYCMGALFILLIDRNVWAQTFGWVSGFSNFSFSLIFFSIFLTLVIPEFSSGANRKIALPEGVGIAALTFVLQLFQENVTFFVLVVSFILFAVTWIRHKRPSAVSTILLVSAIAGASLMFSSQMYDTLLSTGQAVDGYRRLTFDRGKDLFHIFLDLSDIFILTIAPGVYMSSYMPTTAVLTVMLVTLFVKREALSKRLFAGLLVLHICAIAVWTAFLCGVISRPTEDWTHWGQICYSLLVNGGLFLLPLIEVILIFRKEPRQLFRLLCLWLAAPLVIAPMAVINTVGPRVLLTPAYLIGLFCLTVIASDISTIVASRNSRVLRELFPNALAIFSAVALAIVCVRWAFIYRAIGEVKAQRLELFANVKTSEEETISVPAYPYSSYLVAGDPATAKRVIYFKEFYGIPEGVTLIFEGDRDNNEVMPNPQK